MTLGVPSAGADPTPGPDEVERSRANERDTAALVASAEVELISLSAALDTAWDTALAAGEELAEAQVRVDSAKKSAADAQARLDVALTQMEASRRVLAGVAIEQYRNGGSMRTLEAVLSADGFNEVIERTSSLEIVNSAADGAVQQFRADSLIAKTLQDRADAALAEAEDAARRADRALTRANDAQRTAEEAVAQGKARRGELITTLAEARNTTVALERRRQDALDRARRERLEEQARQERENNATPPPPASSARPTSRPTPTPSQQPTSRPEPTRTPEPTREPEPTRTPEPTREPEPTSAPPATTAPPRPTPTPTPTPTPPPAPPATSGYSVGSAAQGRGAVAWARTKIGLPYGWGAVGPNAYDCSGLTSMAWASQGVNITRTSRSQYVRVKKIAYGQMRPGDLIFYGTNPNDPNSITHVAMYTGGNRMIEARVPGVPLSEGAVRYAGTMPFAGRP